MVVLDYIFDITSYITDLLVALVANIGKFLLNGSVNCDFAMLLTSLICCYTTCLVRISSRT